VATHASVPVAAPVAAPVAVAPRRQPPISTRTTMTAHDEDGQEGEGPSLAVLAHRPFVVAIDVAVPVAAPVVAQQAVASGCTSGGVRHQQISDLSLRQWRYMYIHIESDWRREFWTRVEQSQTVCGI